ncbi:MAG: insulinase family protein [Dehalococcoidia bacterium]|nr:insulinase family protein [Dehalococcoidia bacterium]
MKITFKKVTLSNGLDVILHEDHSVPLVGVNVWYHVGSKDEEPGRTGFAHLFEHLMFEGSKNHNRSYFEPLQRVGGVLNGSTNRDRTNYWENLPSNYLELALWLESDRMGFLLDALDEKRFNVQRDVVKNERRQSYENRPYGMAQSHLQSALFPLPHPYHWWTIGEPEDLDAATLGDVKAFFKQFYGPNNASLAIAGDIDADEALTMVQRYFGDIPVAPSFPRQLRRDSDLSGTVSLTIHDKVQLPRLYLSWPSPARFHQDDAATTILAAVLGEGKRSRLFRSLEYEQQLVQEATAFNSPGEIAGQFQVIATPAAGKSIAEVEAAVEEELARLRREPPTAEELDRAKNRLEAMHIYQLEHVGGFGGRADQLNAYNVMAGDPDVINTDLDSFRAVHAEDVQRVARSILGERRVRLVVTPERTLAPVPSTVDRAAQPQGGPSPSFRLPVPVRRALSNGLQVLVIPKRDLPVVGTGMMLATGAMTDPPEQPGLAFLASTLMLEGTKTRSSQQLAAELEFIAADISERTEREFTLLSTDTLTQHWPKALELLSDVVQHPSFPSEEVARIRKQHLTELARAKDDAGRIAERVFPGLLFGRETAYGHPTSGTERAVAGMAQDHFLGHYRARSGPHNSTLLVVGDVSTEQALEQAEAVFGRWANPPAEGAPARTGALPDARSHPTTLYLVDKPGAAQSAIRAGHLSIPRHHKDHDALSVLMYAFGGHFGARLNANLRQEKGYSYGYRSFVGWMREVSSLVAGGDVQTAVTREAVAETLKEFAGIRRERPLSAEELDDAKTGLLRGLPASFETPSQLLERMVQLVQFNLPDDEFARLPARIEAVGLEDVHRVADEHILDDHLAVLVVGDRARVEPGLRELGLPLVLLDAEGNTLAG